MIPRNLGNIYTEVVKIDFDPKDYKIGICCFSAKHTALRRKSKDWLSGNQINVSELERHVYLRTVASVNYKNPTQRVGLVQTEPHHHLIEN